MIELWELPPSPNSTKVRMALRFKGMDFEAHPIDPADRSELVELSGQELTPVIRDRDVILNDSEAILHYLDANYRQTPRLLPTTKASRRECDEWKTRLDDKIARPWFPIFLHSIGRRATFDKEARSGFRDALSWLEEELAGGDTLKDLNVPICDLRVAEWVTYALPSDALMERVPAFRRCKELFGIEDGEFPVLRQFVAPWNERLA